MYACAGYPCGVIEQSAKSDHWSSSWARPQPGQFQMPSSGNRALIPGSQATLWMSPWAMVHTLQP